MLANFSVASELAGLLREYIQEQGITLASLEQRLATDYPDGRMPITEWWQLLALLREHTGLPHIGILLGRLAKPGHGGALGYMVQASRTVAESLTAFQSYQRILYEGAASTLRVEGDQLIAEWPLDYGYSTRESDETLLAGLVSFLRHATGDARLGPSAVGFVQTRPQNTQPYRDFFACAVQFEQPCTFIRFPLGYADIPMVHADPSLFKILEKAVKYELAQMPETEVFLRWFYQHLLLAMHSGEPTVEAVAKRMLMSPRTLARRLAQRGMHFKDALQGSRHQLAEQYLREQRLSHSDIAIQLGYSEQSAFSRAFKSWTGQTPLQFQKRCSVR